MLVFVLNQAQKANTGKIQTPVYENVSEFGMNFSYVEDEKRERSRSLFLRHLRAFYSSTRIPLTVH